MVIMAIILLIMGIAGFASSTVRVVRGLRPYQGQSLLRISADFTNWTSVLLASMVWAGGWAGVLRFFHEMHRCF